MCNWQRLILCLASSVLGACATIPEQQVVSRVETLPPVKIPVMVPCASASDIEPMPATHFRADMTAEQKALAARADLDDLEAWATRSEAILRACATASATTEGK